MEKRRILFWLRLGIAFCSILVMLMIFLGVVLYTGIKNGTIMEGIGKQDREFLSIYFLVLCVFLGIIYSIPIISSIIIASKVDNIKPDSNVLALGIVTIIIANIPAGILLIVYRKALVNNSSSE